MSRQIQKSPLPISYIIPERIGEDYVLIAPDEPDEAKEWTPPESCTLIKTSEYWAMKEALALALSDPAEARPDSGEMEADPEGHPRCPDCRGSLLQCGIDQYRCRRCNEGWTITPLADPAEG